MQTHQKCQTQLSNVRIFATVIKLIVHIITTMVLIWEAFIKVALYLLYRWHKISPGYSVAFSEVLDMKDILPGEKLVMVIRTANYQKKFKLKLKDSF
ncbi:hypothetical protein [Enterococcus faecium]|uniref:hypothetical protein n=1 Tax=Enterococcus faecium TaxID=1352 RepID=UPI003CEA7F2B